MITVLLIMLFWSLYCLAMAILPRRAIRLERRMLQKLRLISTEKLNSPIPRWTLIRTRLAGSLFGIVGLVCGLFVAVYTLFCFYTVPFSRQTPHPLLPTALKNE